MTQDQRTGLKFLLRHLLYGVTGGLVFGAGVLYLDIGSIRSLAFASDNPVLPIFMLFFGLFVTFGSVGMGVGIMSLGRSDQD